jgi:hypothetical protein
MALPSVTVDRYFGQMLNVDTVNVHGRGGRPVASGIVKLTLLDGQGRRVGPVLRETGANQMTFTLNAITPAAGFELFSTNVISIGNARVKQISPLKVTYELNSPMQEALDRSSWRLSATVGTFSVFKAVKVMPSVWLTPSSLGAVSHVKNVAYGDTWVDVHAPANVTLIRSMAYLPGWRATALNSTTGKSEALNVSRDGLIQRVTVPKGDWVIHFHYHAPYIELSLAASVVGVVFILGVGAYLVVDERRRRGDKVRA